MKSCKIIIRVIGYVDDVTGTIILEEANRRNYDEAIAFIKCHPHNNIIWKIKPVINNLFVL